MLDILYEVHYYIDYKKVMMLMVFPNRYFIMTSKLELSNTRWFPHGIYRFSSSVLSTLFLCDFCLFVMSWWTASIGRTWRWPGQIMCVTFRVSIVRQSGPVHRFLWRLRIWWCLLQALSVRVLQQTVREEKGFRQVHHQIAPHTCKRKFADRQTWWRIKS